MVLEQLLTVVGSREKLWNFRATPNDEGLFGVRIVIVGHALILIVVLLHLVLGNLEVGELA